MKTLGKTLMIAGLLNAVTMTAHAATTVDDGAIKPRMPTFETIDPLLLEVNRGGLAPLALALGIASVDLALIGVYWGIYVPYYTPERGLVPRDIH